MPSFYTGKGDDGTTGTLGNLRLPKHHPRMETLGSLDEASAAFGMARAMIGPGAPETGALICEIQRDLYRIMSEVAATPENAGRFRSVDPEKIGWLERQIETLSQGVQMPGAFILPGDTPGSAAVSMARTSVRRAERRISELIERGEMDNPAVLPYLNRLSSLCFLLELSEAGKSGKGVPTLA
jgi:cob(I)alamin adenosyltransferase